MPERGVVGITPESSTPTASDTAPVPNLTPTRPPFDVIGRDWRWRARRILEQLALAVALGLVFAYFAATCPPSFRSATNLQTIARQATIDAVAALGMTIIIASAGIDLSVGAVVALTTVIIAWLGVRGWDPTSAALLGVLAATGCGVVNGLLVAKVRLVPFIATLGTFLVFRGVAKGIADNQKIDAPDAWVPGETWLLDALATLPEERRWMLVPPGVWILTLLAIGTFWMLRKTVFGRHVLAVGSNESAARLCGIPIARVKLAVYAMGGFFAGVAGMLLFSRLTVGDPTVAVGMELNVIAAVVIGGGSLAGGRASVVGTLLGALLMRTINSGSAQRGWDNWKQEIITGAIIIAAVMLDHFRRKRT